MLILVTLSHSYRLEGAGKKLISPGRCCTRRQCQCIHITALLAEVPVTVAPVTVWLYARVSLLSRTNADSSALVLLQDCNFRIPRPPRSYGDTGPWFLYFPKLVAQLATSAPQLRSLEHWYPTSAPWGPNPAPSVGYAPGDPALAVPASLSLLGQLTSLTLGCGNVDGITTTQANAVMQTLPSLQRLLLEAEGHDSLLNGFPVSIATSCSRLSPLELRNGTFGAVPPELGRLTAPTQLALRLARVTSLPESVSQLQILEVSEVLKVSGRGHD